MKTSTHFIHCSKKGNPSCNISINEKYSPVTISINNKETTTEIHLFLNSIQDLVNFKNSFLSSYERAMRGDKDA